MSRRSRERDRVRAQKGLRGEGRHHAEASAGEADADHALLGRLHGVVADRAEMPAVEHGDHADAHALRFLDRQPHRLGADHDAQTPLGVDHRRAR